MPVYAYRCSACGLAVDKYASITDGPPGGFCAVCWSPLRRVYHPPSLARGDLNFEPHYNTTVGATVHTPSEFRSELSRRSDELSARTGLSHRLVPLDPREVRSQPERFGVADPEGTIARRRERERRAAEAGAELRTFGG